MASPITQGDHQPAGVAPVSPSSSDPATAGAVASTHGGDTVSSATKINSLEDLRKKAPELFNKMMEGIAMQICNTMEHYQQRLKKAMREGRND